MSKKKRIFIVVACVLLATAINFSIILSHGTKVFDVGTKNTVTTQKQNPNYFSYKGEDGKNALLLLQNRTMVAQDQSGLVTGINGRNAEKAKHEFWSFYVNGKFATVGPAQYVTKNTDKIEWKIDHY